MANFTGKSIQTVSLGVGVNTLVYNAAHALDIKNVSGGDIQVSLTNDFTDEYFLIEDGDAYNGLQIYATETNPKTVYIKATTAGNISIVCGRY